MYLNSHRLKQHNNNNPPKPIRTNGTSSWTPSRCRQRCSRSRIRCGLSYRATSFLTSLHSISSSSVSMCLPFVMLINFNVSIICEESSILLRSYATLQEANFFNYYL